VHTDTRLQKEHWLEESVIETMDQVKRMSEGVVVVDGVETEVVMDVWGEYEGEGGRMVIGDDTMVVVDGVEVVLGESVGFEVDLSGERSGCLAYF